MTLDNVEIAASLLHRLGPAAAPVEQVDFVDVEPETGTDDLVAYCYLTDGDCKILVLDGLRGLGRDAHREIEAMVLRGVAAAAVRLH